MSFRSGTVAYARFRVSGGPQRADQELLEALAAHVVEPPEVGGPRPVQAGWVGGGHIFDNDFAPDAVVFGDAVVAGVRLDTNQVPAELRRAYLAMARSSGQQRREARDEAEEQCRREAASGRHLRSKLIPVWWDLPRKVLMAPVFGDAAFAALADLVGASVGAKLEPLTAAALAADHLKRRGLTRDYEDLAPTKLTPPPPGAHADGERDATTPVVAWSRRDGQTKDFIGNEFLVWLWAQTAIGSATIRTERTEVVVAIDRALDMECGWEVTGRQSLRADGPTRLPEASAALRLGKWPRKAGLIIAAAGEQWSLVFQADRFLLTAVKLTPPDDPPASPREAMEDRLTRLDALDRTMVDLFDHFVSIRTGSTWSSERTRLRGWIEGLGRHRGAIADKVEVVGV